MAVIGGLAVMVPFFIARAEYGFLRGARSTLAGYVAVAGISSVAFAAMTLAPASELRLRWVLVLGAGPVLLHMALLFWLARISRASAAQVSVAAISMFLLFAYFGWRHVPVPFGELVWYPSDQRLYADLAHGMVSGTFPESRYPPGLGLLLAPFTMLADSAPSTQYDLQAANRLNMAVLPTMISAVTVGFTIVARAALRAFDVRPRQRARLYLYIIPAAIAGAYVLIPAPYIAARNAQLVPRRLLGFVYSAEPFTYLYVAAAFALLAALVHHSERMWSPWMVGIASAFAISLRESNVFFVGALYLLLLTFRPQRRRLMVASLVLFVGLLTQAAYFVHVYGSPVMPNRGVYDGERWRMYAIERYSWDSVSPPPQMSAHFVGTNLTEFLSFYGPCLIIAGASLVAILLSTGGRGWQVCALAGTTIVGYAVFHAAYVHHNPIYRYNWMLIPPFTLLCVAAVAQAHGLRSKRTAINSAESVAQSNGCSCDEPIAGALSPAE